MLEFLEFIAQRAVELIPNKATAVKLVKFLRAVLSEVNVLMRLRAPMAEDILLFSSVYFVHERCSSINKSSDLASSYSKEHVLVDLTQLP